VTVPTPTAPKGLSQQEALYRRAALSQLHILKQQMNLGGLKEGTRSVNLGNGVVVTCRISYNKEDIFVYVPQKATESTDNIAELISGFICIPRLFGENDGYIKQEVVDGTTITFVLGGTGDGSIDYPLNKSNPIFPNEKTSARVVDGKIRRDVQLFGNIDWIGKNTAPEGTKSSARVLTWSGPTGRTIPFDYTKEISGLTTADIKFDPDSPEYYTCFSPNIYESGKVLWAAPLTWKELVDGVETTFAVDVAPKVLGAAYQKDKLVVIVCNHYADKVGFFDEVWVDNKPIYSIASSRPSQCWFFNQSGTKCTRGIYELEIDVENLTVSEKEYEQGIGNYSAKRLTGGATEIKHDGTYNLYSDYTGDVRVEALITVASSKSTSNSGTNNQSTTDTTVYSTYPDGVDPDAPYIIIGPDDYIEGAYTTSGGYCTCGVGEETITYPTTNCGMGTITATNACGQVATKTVRMPNGSWSETVLNTPNCYSGPGTGITYKTSGGSRKAIITSRDGCGYSPTNGTKDCFPLPEGWTYTGSVDLPGVAVTCGSCGTHYITSGGGTYLCGGGACYYYSDGGVLWTTAWVKMCDAGTQTWIC